MKSLIAAALTSAAYAIQVQTEAETAMLPFMMDSHMGAVYGRPQNYQTSLPQYHTFMAPYGGQPMMKAATTTSYTTTHAPHSHSHDGPHSHSHDTMGSTDMTSTDMDSTDTTSGDMMISDMMSAAPTQLKSSSYHHHATPDHVHGFIERNVYEAKDDLKAFHNEV